MDVLGLLGVVAAIVWWIVRREQWKHEPANIRFRGLLSIVSLALLISLSHRIRFSYGGAFAVPLACLAVGVLMSIIGTANVREWMAKPLPSLFDRCRVDIEQ